MNILFKIAHVPSLNEASLPPTLTDIRQIPGGVDARIAL